MENILDAFFMIIIVCWILTGIQGYRMVYAFKKKYPDIAKKKIPSAFTPSYKDNIEINLFFFRKTNIHLFKDDKQIWKLRQQTKILFFLSIVIPIIFALLSIYVFMCQ